MLFLISEPANTDVAPLSVHIIADLDDNASFSLLKEALASMVNFICSLSLV
jgi:hypothetical protein